MVTPVEKGALSRIAERVLNVQSLTHEHTDDAVVIAVYWLTNSPKIGGFEWALGNLWALGAMIALVYGFNALNAESQRQTASELDIESVPASETSADIY